MWDLSSLTRDQCSVPCIERWILYHWTTGEVPSAHFLIELFVFLLLSCISCLYILEIKPLLFSSFADIFSPSVGCLFVLFMVFCAVQKLISLIRSCLFLFFYFYWGHGFLCGVWLELSDYCISFLSARLSLSCSFGFCWSFFWSACIGIPVFLVLSAPNLG